MGTRGAASLVEWLNPPEKNQNVPTRDRLWLWSLSRQDKIKQPNAWSLSWKWACALFCLLTFAGTTSRKRQRMGSRDAFNGNSTLVHGKPTYPCAWRPIAPCGLMPQHREWPDSAIDCLLEISPAGLVDSSRCMIYHIGCTEFPLSAWYQSVL